MDSPAFTKEKRKVLTPLLPWKIGMWKMLFVYGTKTSKDDVFCLFLINRLGKGAWKKSKKKLTIVSFMYVCVAENAELLVYFFTFFCTFPIGNFLS